MLIPSLAVISTITEDECDRSQGGEFSLEQYVVVKSFCYYEIYLRREWIGLKWAIRTHQIYKRLFPAEMKPVGTDFLVEIKAAACSLGFFPGGGRDLIVGRVYALNNLLQSHWVVPQDTDQKRSVRKEG